MTDFDTLRGCVSTSWDKQAEWRENFLDDEAFRDGHQWTDEEKSQLEANNRASIVFNRTQVIIASVAGSEVNNRTEVRFIPREIGDVKPNEVLTAGAEWFRDQADAEDAESMSFTDLVTGGLGATETKLDFDEDPEGEPEIERIHPPMFGWDHTDNSKGLTKKRYAFRVLKMDIETAKERFPGKEVYQINATWLDKRSSETPHITNPDDDYDDDQKLSNSPSDGMVTVVQVQYRTREAWVEYVDPQTGQREEMKGAQWAVLEKRSPALPPHRKFKKTIWTQYFLGSMSILDTNQPDPEGCTFNAMTGNWDSKDKMFFGLIRSMRDPQRYANKWLSQNLHIMNANAKGGVIVDVSAVDDVNTFEEDWSAADSVTYVKAGGLDKIREKTGPAISAGLMGLTEFAISSIRDVSGVNMELLGLRDANQPGVLEYQRRQSAMTTLAIYFDSLRFYRKRQGRTILNFITNYLAPMGVMARVVKEDNVKYVPLAAGVGTQKYDVIVDDAPQAPNEKEKSWAVIQAMMPMLQQADLSLDDWADVLEYSPLPSSFADKVRQKAKEQQKQGPSPEQQAAMQLEMQKTQSEIAENMANAQLDTAKTQQIGIETQLAPAQVAADLFKPMNPNTSQ